MSYPLSGATAPIIDVHDYAKGPKVVYQDEHGLKVTLGYSKSRDSEDLAPWFLEGTIGKFLHEGPWEYDIPETQDIRQFAGETIVRAWNMGRLEVKA